MSQEVIRPYLVGSEVNRDIDQTPSRWIIDFTGMSLERAQQFKGAFKYLLLELYPRRTSELERKTEREKESWWYFERPRPELRKAIQGLDQFLVLAGVSPHLVLVFATGEVVPSNRLKVITLGTLYHFGILQSAMHESWAHKHGSTLEERLSYTTGSVFETFPFPLLPDGGYDPRVVPDTPEAREVSRIAEELYTKRQAACRTLNLGLTKLYNLIKGKKDSKGVDPYASLTVEHQRVISELRTLHEQLNSAVCACYGWPEDTWRDENEVLSRLLELNLQLASI
jgi:hypothetical protein